MGAQIAVVASSFRSGFPALVYGHLQKCVQPGETLVECATLLQSDAAVARQRLLSLLASGQELAALIGICVRPDAEALAALRARRVPVVLIDEEAEGASTVAVDNFAGGYLAGRHLAGTGRRGIAVVCGARTISGGYNATQRVNGFAKALVEHGVPFSEADVVESVEYNRKDGMTAMARLLDGRRKVDAVFCAAGDFCAAGVLAVARERGVKVPGQVAVIGYDDIPQAAIADPPLTTIRQPLARIAREAHRLATEAPAALLAAPKRVLLPPELVVRTSA
jgi:DNA-binding LacI/PurR family transcriptional regulator